MVGESAFTISLEDAYFCISCEVVTNSADVAPHAVISICGR